MLNIIIKVGRSDVYVDDIIIIEITEEDVIRTVEELICKGKDNGLQANNKKTKYLIVFQRKQIQESLVFGDLTFKSVSNLKYLGVDINLQANSHEEINRAENKCCFALVPLFISRLLSKNMKLRLYKMIIRLYRLFICTLVGHGH